MRWAAFLEARLKGKLRFIGFTGHKDPLIHLRMLQVAKENDFHFDTVQMPINVMDAHFRSFSAQVLPILILRNPCYIARFSLEEVNWFASDQADTSANGF